MFFLFQPQNAKHFSRVRWLIHRIPKHVRVPKMHKSQAVFSIPGNGDRDGEAAATMIDEPAADQSNWDSSVEPVRAVVSDFPPVTARCTSSK